MHTDTSSRRGFLKSAAACGTASLLGFPARADDAGSKLVLPELPYPPEALEPHVDAATMRLHHGKHHAAYIAALAKALDEAGHAERDAGALIQQLDTLPEVLRGVVRNHGGGHVNHSLFWQWMAPAGSGPTGPDGVLGEALRQTFGSIDSFKQAFAAAAMKRFGSGWAWLVAKPDGRLVVTSTANQDNPRMRGVVPEAEAGVPVLGLDVWEHAYYLHYQNRRADYIAAWWNVVNWREVAAAYERARA